MQRYSSSSLALARRAVRHSTTTTTTRTFNPTHHHHHQHVRFASALPPRSSTYTKLTPTHITQLRSFLSSPTSLMSTLDASATMDDLRPFNDDWMNKYHGKGQVVVKPKSTEEVASVMKYCWENGIAVVPQGGNTGLVGGSTPVHDELVLNLSNMSSIRSFDPISGTLTVDAGAILETVDNYLSTQGHIFPLDLGAKGSCQIGGNIATNAGGLRLLRYGSLHGSVLGLEVVLPDGTVWDGLGGGLRKDNTGFDMKQLFIGSEGTIGVITGVTVLTPKRPTAMNVAVFSLSSYEAVQQVYRETKSHLGEILSAFEFFDKQAFDLVRRHQREGGEAEKKVFEQEGEFYVLVETGGSRQEHDEEKLQGLLENLMENDLILDGVLAQDTTQYHSLWKLRELIPESAGKSGSVYKYDLSVPVPKMYSLVEKMRTRLIDSGLFKEEGGGRVREIVGYGHIGDGNLHINICADKYDEEIEKVIEPYVYEITAEEKGSISAEHGLGLMKAPYIGYSKDQISIDLMRRVKKMFDPKGILNPYKFIL